MNPLTKNSEIRKIKTVSSYMLNCKPLNNDYTWLLQLWWLLLPLLRSLNLKGFSYLNTRTELCYFDCSCSLTDLWLTTKKLWRSVDLILETEHGKRRRHYHGYCFNLLTPFQTKPRHNWYTTPLGVRGEIWSFNIDSVYVHRGQLT